MEQLNCLFGQFSNYDVVELKYCVEKNESLMVQSNDSHQFIYCDVCAIVEAKKYLKKTIQRESHNDKEQWKCEETNGNKSVIFNLHTIFCENVQDESPHVTIVSFPTS